MAKCVSYDQVVEDTEVERTVYGNRMIFYGKDKHITSESIAKCLIQEYHG
jgi:hypothetical protein